jgi:hypothetical protein
VKTRGLVEKGRVNVIYHLQSVIDNGQLTEDVYKNITVILKVLSMYKQLVITLVFSSIVNQTLHGKQWFFL